MLKLLPTSQNLPLTATKAAFHALLVASGIALLAAAFLAGLLVALTAVTPQGESGTEPLLVTWYDPALGGINCEPYCDGRFANGEAITADHYLGGSKQTAACIAEWHGLQVTIIRLGTFTCRDRGGAIVRTVQGVHIDILSKTAVTCPNDCRYIVHWPNSEFPTLPAALYGRQGYRLVSGWHGSVSGFEGYDFVSMSGCGAALYAPVNGVVVYNGRDGYVGQYDHEGEQNSMLTIAAADGSEIVLFHGVYTASRGQTVRAGRTIIGKEASEGNSLGCHTHLVKRAGGTAVSFRR